MGFEELFPPPKENHNSSTPLKAKAHRIRFIHGTSSQALSLMRQTDFQLMPVIAMLEKYKIAPMTGELTAGGFDIIGKDSNSNTLIGAPAFGRVQNCNYNLKDIVERYAQRTNEFNADRCKMNFKYYLQHSHKSAFSTLNLLMIYLVRLRQSGVKLADIASADEINTLKTRLNATIQFYYFILCIQKYIFIDGEEIGLFKEENKLDGAVDDYLDHFFSFENFIEKLAKTPYDIEEIYNDNDPSAENIVRLLDFVKVSKGSQTGDVIANRDYHFFSAEQYQPNGKTWNSPIISGYLFNNNSNHTLALYLAQYYRAYANTKKNPEQLSIFPDFETVHSEAPAHIAAMKDRIQLCNTLLDANDDEFTLYNERDELVTKPFPVIFVTEAKTVEHYGEEYRSRAPLALGKEIVLLATDNKEHQKRLRDYLQKNNVGPVEVLLFDDLRTLGSEPPDYFEAFANEEVMKAFELAKRQNCVEEFSRLYRALSELNEKRYRFKSTNPEMYKKLNDLFIDIQHKLLTEDKEAINFRGIQQALQRNRQENHTLYATHRGVLGIIDTVLTVLASLVVFYPITYLVQKNRNSTHTFFATDTEKKVNFAIDVVDDIINPHVAI